MKNQSGKSPLGWIITIAVALLIAGVSIAMIFAGNEDVSNKIEQYQNTSTETETDTNNTVENEVK